MFFEYQLLTIDNKGVKTTYLKGLCIQQMNIQFEFDKRFTTSSQLSNLFTNYIDLYLLV